MVHLNDNKNTPDNNTTETPQMVVSVIGNQPQAETCETLCQDFSPGPKKARTLIPRVLES